MVEVLKAITGSKVAMAEAYVLIDTEVKRLKAEAETLKESLRSKIEDGGSVETRFGTLSRNETTTLKPNADTIAHLKSLSLFSKVRKPEAVDTTKLRKLADSKPEVLSCCGAVDGDRFTIKR